VIVNIVFDYQSTFAFWNDSANCDGSNRTISKMVHIWCFWPLNYFRGTSEKIGIERFLLQIYSHHVGKFQEYQLSGTAETALNKK